MKPFIERVIGPLKTTPVRSFILYPLLALAWELFLGKGRLHGQPIFLGVMAWGYLQYRLCGKYRIKRGGGGPGMDTPPERLVTTGPFAYARNPMYLGHIIFLTGLALTLRSYFASALTVGTAIWFHYRVLRDEQRLVKRFGEPYIRYQQTVKRWLPGLF